MKNKKTTTLYSCVLFIGWRLIDVQNNVFSWTRMLEFRDFLHHQGEVYPVRAAVVSVYAQFICLAALYIAHFGASFQDSFDAIMMLAGSLFFLF